MGYILGSLAWAISTIKWPRKGCGKPSCDIQVWWVGIRALALGYLDLFKWLGKSVQYLLNGTVLTWVPGSILTTMVLVPFRAGRSRHVYQATWPSEALSVKSLPSAWLPVVMEARLAQPLSLAFWYCSQWASSILQWERRADTWVGTGPVT